MLGRPCFHYPQWVESGNVDSVESAEMLMFLVAKVEIRLQFLL